MIKKNYLYLLVCCLLTISLVGCDENSDGYPVVDGKSPSITMVSSNIMTEPGGQFKIEAEIADADGIASIELSAPYMYLEKTIDLLSIYDEILTSYDLDYSFKVRNDEIASSFKIAITVTDVCGNISVEEISINLDGDYYAPEFTDVPDNVITFAIVNEEDIIFNLQFRVRDNKSLDYAEVSIPEIEYSERIEADGKNTLSFAETFTFPSEESTYSLNITVFDKAGLKVEQNSVITITNIVGYENMYLADVATDEQLNSDQFGVPMLIERKSEHDYEAKYYNKTVGTEIFFLPQKTAFTPVCFGIDPSNREKLTTNLGALPIVLDQAGVYYKIEFNIVTKDFSIATYTPTDTPLPIGDDVYLDASRPGEGTIPFLIGVLAKPRWPSTRAWDLLELKQDPTNKFLFYAEADMTEGDKLEEMIITRSHSWGWWPEPCWRFASNNEIMVLNGGDNITITVARTGKYKFEFDTHLLRFKLYPVNQ